VAAADAGLFTTLKIFDRLFDEFLLGDPCAEESLYPVKKVESGF